MVVTCPRQSGDDAFQMDAQSAPRSAGLRLRSSPPTYSRVSATKVRMAGSSSSPCFSGCSFCGLPSADHIECVLQVVSVSSVTAVSRTLPRPTLVGASPAAPPTVAVPPASAGTPEIARRCTAAAAVPTFKIPVSMGSRIRKRT